MDRKKPDYAKGLFSVLPPSLGSKKLSGAATRKPLQARESLYELNPSQKIDNSQRYNRKMRSNSPPNLHVKHNFLDDDNLNSDYCLNNPRQLIREDVRIQWFKENISPNKIMSSSRNVKHMPITDTDPDLEIHEKLHKLASNSNDFFDMYDMAMNFPVDIQPPANSFPGELRDFFETHSLYKLRRAPRQTLKALSSNEPYIKLTVLKTNFDNNTAMNYCITPKGMINSNRNTDHDDIIIGRQQITPEGIIPNDICLFYTDRATSRVHAKLVTKYGFNVPREIPENFMAFLMMSHKRTGVKSPGYRLYKGLYRHIFSFIKEPKKFWLVDLGSVFGTYIKLKPTITYSPEKGQTYLIGLDTFFNISDVNKGQKNQKTLRQLSGQSEPNSRSLSAETNEFLKFLMQEKVYNKCEIHGLSETETSVLDLMIESHNASLYEEDSIFNETASNEHCFERPYLKIEIQNYRGIHTSPSHLFVANPVNNFTLGRMQGCDVNLNLNTISRRQCRFIYDQQNWYITDGTDTKESANGTWISLTDYRVKRERIESEPREIVNGSEIKISDITLKVEIFNNE